MRNGNMEIEVGEYVRTIYGEIFKVVHTTKQKEKYVFVDKYVDRNEDRAENDSVLNITDIVKHSKNLIDIIEVGDYVNGKRIDAILDGGFKIEGFAERVLCFEIDFPIEQGLRAYHNCDIESILTKEQYQANCYVVESEE